MQNVVAHIVDDGTAVKGTAIFKMQIKTAKIHIGAAHDGDRIVADIHFSVQETGGVLENAHARLQQLAVVAAGEDIDIGLVWNTRGDDAHIDPAFCREGKGGLQLVINDKVRGCDIDITLCTGDDVEVRAGRDVFVVERGVGIGLHEPVGDIVAGGKVGSVVWGGIIDKAPDFKKGCGERIDRWPAQHKSRVFPVAKALFAVDVLIRKVEPAGKADLAVDDANFAVVAMVEKNVLADVCRHPDGVENARLNAIGAQSLLVPFGQGEQAAKAVPHNTDIDPFGCLAPQHGKGAVPHDAGLDDKILHKNAVLRLLELGQKSFKKIFAAFEITALGVTVQRCRRAGIEVFGLTRKGRIYLVQHFKQKGLRDHGGIGLALDLRKPLCDFGAQLLPAPQKVHHSPGDGQQHGDDDPHDLIRGVEVIFFEHKNQHQNAEDNHHGIGVRADIAELPDKKKEKADLNEREY